MRFNSFDQVASWYERTKPLISKNHTKSHDVRPIMDRNRKWERIKKIDDNTYALCDGNYGNNIWSTYSAAQEEFENTMAPITWMRREDGDFIRIRNHTKQNISVTRYNFLAYTLPLNMAFNYNQQGKHWVRAKTQRVEGYGMGYEEFLLPKCNVKFHQTEGVYDDNMYLMFRVNNDGTFTRVGDKLSVEVKQVDKDLKKQWRERLDAFYNYCAAIGPMIDTSWSGQQEYATQIREWRIAQLPAGGRIDKPWVRNVKHMPRELMRDVVTQEDHPMRVAVAAMVVADIGGKRAIESQDDVRSIRAAYNRVMNEALGFYKIEQV